jgi:hypothetical protein
MAQMSKRLIQEACDDVFCDPEDLVASQQLQRLLGAKPGRVLGSVVSRRDWRRLVKIACEELHDDPTDMDARNRLLLLMAAGGSGQGDGVPMTAA